MSSTPSVCGSNVTLAVSAARFTTALPMPGVRCSVRSMTAWHDEHVMPMMPKLADAVAAAALAAMIAGSTGGGTTGHAGVSHDSGSGATTSAGASAVAGSSAAGAASGSAAGAHSMGSSVTAPPAGAKPAAFIALAIDPVSDSLSALNTAKPFCASAASTVTPGISDRLAVTSRSHAWQC